MERDARLRHRFFAMGTTALLITVGVLASLEFSPLQEASAQNHAPPREEPRPQGVSPSSQPASHPTSQPTAQPAATAEFPYTSVLLAGDSMVGLRCCLSETLRGLVEGKGARFSSDAWSGVGIQAFERSPRFATLLQKKKPEVVLISLGTNDSTVPNPGRLAPAIRAIVRRIQPRPCVWLAPPTATADTGIVQVIADSIAPCTFFDARPLGLERMPDGIHLTNQGGGTWAEAFWRAWPNLTHRPREGDTRQPGLWGQ